jgi:hypothetical protein
VTIRGPEGANDKKGSGESKKFCDFFRQEARKSPLASEYTCGIGGDRKVFCRGPLTFPDVLSNLTDRIPWIRCSRTDAIATQNLALGA